MNSSWQDTSLGEVVEIQFGNAFKSAEFADAEGGIRLLRGDNVVQGSLRWNNAKFWPVVESHKVEKYLLQASDVVLAMDRPWIEAGLKYAAIRQQDLPSLLVQRVARLRGKKGIDQGFLRWVIGSPEFTRHVLGVQTGTAVPHISGDQIRSYRFELPSLDEQRRIAGVLGTLDDLIDTNEKLSDNLRALVRGSFAHLVQTPGLTLPASSVMDLKYGKALPSRDRTPGPYPVVSSAGIVDYHDSAIVQGPGIVVGRKGTVGSVTWVEDDFFPIDTAFYVTTELPLLFAYLSIERMGLADMNTDSAVPGLNRQNALSRSVRMPTDEALARFSEESGRLWSAAKSLHEEKTALERTRDELLPLLMSGKIRVRETGAL